MSLHSHPQTLTDEKATEVLKEVKAAQATFRQQRDLAQLENEVSTKNWFTLLILFYYSISLPWAA